MTRAAPLFAQLVVFAGVGGTAVAKRRAALRARRRVACRRCGLATCRSRSCGRVMCWSKSMPLASTNSTPRRFNPGDEVYARPDKDRIGTFAEFITMNEADVALKPKNLSMETAASILKRSPTADY